MVQIKLSVAFVLAAAAIVPVVAQPTGVREGREHADDVGHRRHHQHHHHHHHVEHDEQPSPEAHHHHHFEAPVPQDSTSDSPKAPFPSRREYVDEIEVRGLLFGQNDHPNLLSSLGNTLGGQDAQLEHKHQVLEGEDGHLEHKNGHLEHKNSHLEHKDHSLERQDGELKHKHHSLEGEDKSLKTKKHRLGGQDKELGRKRKSLNSQVKSLKGKHSSLKHQNKVLGKKDTKLALKGKGLAHKNKGIAQKGNTVEHHDKVLKQKGGVPHGHGTAVHSGPKIIEREYAESDDVFERDSASIESGANTAPLRGFRGPERLGPGPVVFPHHGAAIHPHIGRPLRFGLGTTPHFGRPFRGHGPVVHPKGGPVSRRQPLHFHVGTVRHQEPVSSKVAAREYSELEDMFERDFEDGEFDARDFDDELYLD